MKINVTLLNDTDIDGSHIGCMRVKENLKRLFAKHNMQLVHSVKCGANVSDHDIEAIFKATDLVVINGEGTIHHGRPKAEALLTWAAKAQSMGINTALINCLYQDNPQSWGAYLSDLSVIATRDSKSSDEVRKAANRDVVTLGDLSMYATPPRFDETERKWISISDSISKSKSLRLEKLAIEIARHNADLVYAPIFTGHGYKSYNANTKTKLTRLIKGRRAKGLPASLVRTFDTPNQYIEHLGQSKLAITGRFHTVCLSVMTRTPFIAVTSNSWKIESLIRDIGLSERRLIPLEDLSPSLLTQNWDYSTEERDAIDHFLDTNTNATDALFRQLTRLGIVPGKA